MIIKLILFFLFYSPIANAEDCNASFKLSEVSLDNGARQINFNWKLTGNISSKLIWNDLISCMQSSLTCELWPKGLSKISSRNQSIEQGIKIYVKYYLLFNLGKTQSYFIKDLNDDDQLLSYRVSNGHSFSEGGADIEISEIDEVITQVSWQGYYHIKSGQGANASFFKSYSHKFFKALEKNICRYV